MNGGGTHFGGSLLSLGASEAIAEESDGDEPKPNNGQSTNRRRTAGHRGGGGGSRVAAVKRQLAERSNWLSIGQHCGHVRLFVHHRNRTSATVLLPCQLDTPAAKLIAQSRADNSDTGGALSAIYVETPDGRLRRLGAQERPLQLQDSLLSQLGHAETGLRQWLGAGPEVPQLIRFHVGKPAASSSRTTAAEEETTAREILLARRCGGGGGGGRWRRRLCELEGPVLRIFREGTAIKLVIFLPGGRVDTQTSSSSKKSSGHRRPPHRLDVRSCGGDRSSRSTCGAQLAFNDEASMREWQQRLELATSAIYLATKTAPPQAISQPVDKADLSNRQLNLMPESVFHLGDRLLSLNLRRNCLQSSKMTPDSSASQRGDRLSGHLEDIQIFRNLTSLDLSENFLTTLPACLCRLRSLTELNIAANQIAALPNEISNLIKLRSLYLYNNRLTELPDSMTSLAQLSMLLIAFNRFEELPPVLACLPSNSDVILPGNQLSSIPDALAQRLDAGGIKRINLRFNRLVAIDSGISLGLAGLTHLVYLDLRDNLIETLDLQPLSHLEFLSCDRNRLADIFVNGTALRTLLLVENKLQSLKISPPPKRLECLDVSDNRLDSLPDCLWPSGRASLLRLHAGGNEIRRLPADIWRCVKLQSLRLERNRIAELPAAPAEAANGLTELLELCLHSNQLTRLPAALFHLTPALVELNLANNQLVELPKLPLRNSGNRLQVLTASFNQFSDADVSFLAENFGSSLRTLLLAFNRLTEINDETMLQFCELRELNISGNQLKTLPSTLSRLERLVTIRAHSNCLQRLPDLSDSPRLRTLDVGCNSTLSGSVRNLMESRLSFLDLSCNQQMGMSMQDLASPPMQVTLKHCLFSDRGIRKLKMELGAGSPAASWPSETVTKQPECTRMLGWSSLHPVVVPDPQVTQLNLTEWDDALVLANRGLWSHVGHEVVAAEVLKVAHPVAAAKRLVDLAQSHGSSGNICVLIVKIRPELLARAPSFADEDFAASSSVFSFDSDQSEDRRDRLACGMRDRLASEVKHQELDADLAEALSGDGGSTVPDDRSTTWTWQRRRRPSMSKRSGIGAGMSGLLLRHVHASLTASDVGIDIGSEWKTKHRQRRYDGGGDSGDDSSDWELDWRWDAGSSVGYPATLDSRRSSIPGSQSASGDAVDFELRESLNSRAAPSAVATAAAPASAVNLGHPHRNLVDTGTEPEAPGCDFRLSVQLPVPNSAQGDENTWL
uniref:PPM-type phosphatase domain-containing protein n=1 Tax=Macrostomum lignano TaxID=282301 RepID=A0A1I8J4G0_9PLAT